MVFMMSVAIMLWLAIALGWRAILRHPSTTNPSETGRTIVSLMLPTMLLSTPIFIEIVQVGLFFDGGGVSLGYTYLPMCLVGAGSITSLAVFGYRFNRQRLAPEPGFFSVGSNVIGLLISAYLVFVTLDQFMFYVPHRKDAGSVSWKFFKNEVTDIKCNSELLLVNIIDSTTATYRCPAPLQMVLGRFSGAPFVAWPSYTEGHSDQLAAVIRKMRAEAK